jgi:uncharacterized protein (TIGR00255 family)
LPTVNLVALDAGLAALKQVQARAEAQGIALAAPSAADILALRGVLDGAAPADDPAALRAALMHDFEPLLAAFLEMRDSEGMALNTVLNEQLDRIAALTEAAALTADARREGMQQNLRRSLGRVMQNSDGADPARVAQELALIAVKSDVTEEIDRLRAHVDAARDLLAADAPVGRKLDFLMQEFNREANTLCSKAQNTELTRTGLDLKTVIDQMREQVQNVE